MFLRKIADDKQTVNEGVAEIECTVSRRVTDFKKKFSPQVAHVNINITESALMPSANSLFNQFDPACTRSFIIPAG